MVMPWILIGHDNLFRIYLKQRFRTVKYFHKYSLCVLSFGQYFREPNYVATRIAMTTFKGVVSFSFVRRLCYYFLCT
jgi:hypothetical protein